MVLVGPSNCRKPCLLTAIRTLRQMFSEWEFDGSCVNTGKSEATDDKVYGVLLPLTELHMLEIQ